MIQFQSILVSLIIFAASIGCIQHIIISYKHRDKSGIIEGLAMTLIFYVAIAMIIYYAFFKVGR